MHNIKDNNLACRSALQFNNLSMDCKHSKLKLEKKTCLDLCPVSFEELLKYYFSS